VPARPTWLALRSEAARRYRCPGVHAVRCDRRAIRHGRCGNRANRPGYRVNRLDRHANHANRPGYLVNRLDRHANHANPLGYLGYLGRPASRDHGRRVSDHDYRNPRCYLDLCWNLAPCEAVRAVLPPDESSGRKRKQGPCLRGPASF